jgi:hypothetical protein
MNSTAPEPNPVISGRQLDALQQFFQRPLFLSLTIGIPFCIFKLLFGLTLIRVGSTGSISLVLSGWLIICWSLLDLGMNMGRELFDLLGRPAPFEYCTIAQLGRFFRRPMAFLAVDTLLTFTIICTMLWSGWIVLLNGVELHLWYAATTLNLISLSLVVLYNEIRNS